MLELGFVVPFSQGHGFGFVFARKGVVNQGTFAFCVNYLVLSVELHKHSLMLVMLLLGLG